MKIYTRAEAGLRPPGKVMGHYPKRGLMIHHTASGNGLMSLERELEYQRNCQRWHIQEHGATDILQAATIFQSGRIVEGRMPWNSDNGAIYNWGGGAANYVGIECDGTFYGLGASMGQVQYSSLVWLGAYLVRLGVLPRDMEVVGHQQVYPCRPGDPKATACPGNLLGQFVTNGKLKRDILAHLGAGGGPKDEEEDEMLLVKKGHARWLSAGLPESGKTYFDLVAQEKDARVQLWFKRDNGDEPAKEWVPRLQRDLKKGQPFRFESGQFFNVKGGIAVMVDVLSGGPVLVIRKQTMGG